MSNNLSSDSNKTPAVSVADALTISGRPANRMILLGDPKWVQGIIHSLHSFGLAEVGTRKQNHANSQPRRSHQHPEAFQRTRSRSEEMPVSQLALRR